METYDFTTIAKRCETLFFSIAPAIQTSDLADSFHKGKKYGEELELFILDFDNKFGAETERSVSKAFMDCACLDTLKTISLSYPCLFLLRLRLWAAKTYLNYLSESFQGTSCNPLLQLQISCSSEADAVVWATTVLWSMTRFQFSKTLARETVYEICHE